MAKFVFIFSILIAVSCVSSDVSVDPQPIPSDNTTVAPVTTTSSPPTTTKAPPTTLPPSTTTTTQAPTTTTPPPSTTSTTQAPTTTTLPPSTTTTTQAPSTTSTTQAPTTTTVAPPTPAPTPNPAPSTGTWNVTTADKKTVCIVLETAARVNVTYSPKVNQTISTLVNVPVNGTTVTGNCGETQDIKISWAEGSLEMVFGQDKGEFMVKNVTFTVELNGTTIIGIYNKAEFKTPLKMSYKCDHDEVISLINSTTNATVAELSLAHLQLEAFRTENSTTFSKAQFCWSPTTDVVPIVVGCALAGLVVVVLVAYLVGRRRAARGYHSM